jgi:hypothetical protein
MDIRTKAPFKICNPDKKVESSAMAMTVPKLTVLTLKVNWQH